jgi:hypothetical protein
LLTNFNFAFFQQRGKSSAPAHQDKCFHSSWPQRVKTFITKQDAPKNCQHKPHYFAKWHRLVELKFISVFFLHYL